MRVGIYRSYSPVIGGGYHYEMVALKALSEIAPRSGEEFVCLCNPIEEIDWLAAQGGLTFRGLPIQTLKGVTPPERPPEAYLANVPKAGAPFDVNGYQYDPESARLMRSGGIDLIMQLNSHPFGFGTVTPFVIPIHDLNHRLQPEFPEVSAFGETNLRDFIYTNICKYATLVLVESELGKSHVLQFYGDHITEDRIRVLPLYPPFERGVMPEQNELERVKATYELPARYFFYPAQFWRHKNHELIIRALRIIADKTGEKIPVVFCGTYVDYFRALNFKKVVALANELGVIDQVQYLGRVPNEDMGPLYRLSCGLVMPTFFGPTNIPPLEAWNFGRPVICSDIPGIREQIGDAGLLVDPRSPEALAEAMLRLWRDQALATELVARGQQRLAGYNWSDYVERLAAIVDEACQRVRDGRSPRFPNVEI